MSIKLLPRERYYAAFRHGFNTNQDGELGTVRWRRWLAKSPFEPNEPESQTSQERLRLRQRVADVSLPQVRTP